MVPPNLTPFSQKLAVVSPGHLHLPDLVNLGAGHSTLSHDKPDPRALFVCPIGHSIQDA